MGVTILEGLAIATTERVAECWVRGVTVTWPNPLQARRVEGVGRRGGQGGGRGAGRAVVGEADARGAERPTKPAVPIAQPIRSTLKYLTKA